VSIEKAKDSKAAAAIARAQMLAASSRLRLAVLIRIPSRQTRKTLPKITVISFILCGVGL
jgi:hypothetical protein